MSETKFCGDGIIDLSILRIKLRNYMILTWGWVDGGWWLNRRWGGKGMMRWDTPLNKNWINAILWNWIYNWISHKGLEFLILLNNTGKEAVWFNLKWKIPCVLCFTAQTLAPQLQSLQYKEPTYFLAQRRHPFILVIPPPPTFTVESGGGGRAYKFKQLAYIWKQIVSKKRHKEINCRKGY